MYYVKFDAGAVIQEGGDPHDFAGEFIAAFVYDRAKGCRRNIKSIIHQLEDTDELADVLVGVRSFYRRIMILRMPIAREGGSGENRKWKAALSDALRYVRSRLSQMKLLFLEPLMRIAIKSAHSQSAQMKSIASSIEQLMEPLSSVELLDYEKVGGFLESIWLKTDILTCWTQNLLTYLRNQPEVLEAYLRSQDWVEEKLLLMNAFEESSKHGSACLARRDPAQVLSDISALHRLATANSCQQRLRFVSARNQTRFETDGFEGSQTESKQCRLLKSKNAFFLFCSKSTSTAVSIHSPELAHPLTVDCPNQRLFVDSIFPLTAVDSMLFCTKKVQKSNSIISVSTVGLVSQRQAETRIVRMESVDTGSVGDSFYYRDPIHLLTYSSNKRVVLDCWQIERNGTLIEQQPQTVFTIDKKSDFLLTRVSTFVDLRVIFLMLESGDDFYSSGSRLQLKSFHISRDRKRLAPVHECTYQSKQPFIFSWVSLSSAPRLTGLLGVSRSMNFSLFVFDHCKMKFASISQGNNTFSFRKSLASKYSLLSASLNSWIAASWQPKKQQLLLLHSSLTDRSASSAEPRACLFYIHSFKLK